MREARFPDKPAVRRAFERAAATYDRHAVLQAEVGTRLLEHLEGIRIEPRRILDLGCGTGAGFDLLLSRFSKPQIVGLDIAHGMLQRARQRAPLLRRLLRIRHPRLVCGDAERLPLAAGACQLVYSNLALQWCRPHLVFPEAARVLDNGGLFIFSTFGPDTLKELRAAFASVDGAEHVNTFIDMHDLGDALVQAGFADPVMEMEVVTLEYATVKDVARDLQGIGARNAMPGRPRGLGGRGRWERAVAGYEKHRRGGVLPATYEVIYGHAWKVPPRKTADGRQVIDFPRRGRSVTRGVFVTGTDTGVGKTLACAALLHALRAAGARPMPMKPIAAGASESNGRWVNDDTLALMRAAGLTDDFAADVTPILLREPMAPHVAAARAQTPIGLAPVTAAFQRLRARGDFIVVEGVGGFDVPLADGLDTVDLARALGLPVVLVVGMRLGCLNHALLTARAIAAAGLPFAGWIANHLDPRMAVPDENVAALDARLAAPRLGRLPFATPPDPASLARHLDVALLLHARR